MSAPAVRIGMEGGRVAVLRRVASLGAPILVSANSLWRHKIGKFQGFKCYAGFDTALDSGGFVAMKRYGGYRWSVRQYVELAREMRPTWFAQMDFCCEPEIAANRGEVYARIDRTAEYLHACQDEARAANIAPPLPVLQGWQPEDYCAGPIYSTGYQWPALVGIGSVCRRNVEGPNGILAVMSALDRKVPAGVQFHLFGVKSQALQKLTEQFPGRVASVDSMAWRTKARWDCHHAGRACRTPELIEALDHWYAAQTRPGAPVKIELWI